MKNNISPIHAKIKRLILFNLFNSFTTLESFIEFELKIKTLGPTPPIANAGISSPFDHDRKRNQICHSKMIPFARTCHSQTVSHDLKELDLPKRIIRLLFLLIFLSLTSCQEKFVRKEITNGDITVRWCYYSFWRDYSPDFVEVEKGWEDEIIFKAEDVLTDIEIHDRQIILDLYKPERGIIYDDESKDNLGGYAVEFRNHENYDDYLNIPGRKNKKTLANN